MLWFFSHWDICSHPINSRVEHVGRSILASCFLCRRPTNHYPLPFHISPRDLIFNHFLSSSTIWEILIYQHFVTAFSSKFQIKCLPMYPIFLCKYGHSLLFLFKFVWKKNLEKGYFEILKSQNQNQPMKIE